MKYKRPLNENVRPAVSLKTQWWLFTKRSSNLLLLAVFFAAGSYGLYQGYSSKKKQVTTIEAFCQEKKTTLKEMTKGFDADTTTAKGKAAFTKVTTPILINWYIVLPAFKMPVSTAIFSIGQTDVFPYYYTVNTESFFMQLFKQGEIANPLRSLSGHFDVNFWVIYLLPLLIILLGFNTLSAELGNGNWRLVNSQGISARQWLSSKFLLVGLLIQIMVTGVFFGGLAINLFFFEQFPMLNDFLFLTGASLYLYLWLSIIYAINAIGKSTPANALYCGIAWAAACIIMPTLVTMTAERLLPVDNTSVSRMSRRPQGSKFEDEGFGVETIKKLGNAHPEFGPATIGPSSPAFRFAVYMAYHKLMDDTNTVTVKHYYRQIEKRQRLTNLSGFINPAAATDGIFSALTDNDAFANHGFVWQTKAFHARLHDAYFPPFFSGRQLTKRDYDKFPVFRYKPAGLSLSVFINYLLLLFIAVFIVIVSNRKLKQREY